ncbi:hypothetical protein [Microbacterium sp. 77mftsu3.1]|uniref:hypothetical protein n=1 Tax=Microbacterium sp. 77mftsu3.1 TaxID=1761802 RepID=UPI00036C81E9|nr:hypothetical protein [Microbacterium sp. 77mftsu3.1]SDH37794.1 hypothetical protein SAMN04488590_3177 [Microbacterium sp. 77mftsu3.1]
MSVFERHGVTITLSDLIEMVEGTPEDAWQVDVVRSEDDSRNCFFGHLYAYAEKQGAHLDVSIIPAIVRERRPELTAAEHLANGVWDWFESEWASTYAIYPVNDGKHPRYPQPTPRQRVLAYLHALAAGDEMTTMQAMDYADCQELHSN